MFGIVVGNRFLMVELLRKKDNSMERLLVNVNHTYKGALKMLYLKNC